MKLTTIGEIPAQQLTNKTTAPFIISFKYKLEKGYTFKELEVRNLKDFQAFLDRISQMTFQEVDTQYKRPSDKKDKFKGNDIVHYGYANGSRIHGVIEGGRFKVLRIDPCHKFHK